MSGWVTAAIVGTLAALTFGWMLDRTLRIADEALAVARSLVEKQRRTPPKEDTDG